MNDPIRNLYHWTKAVLAVIRFGYPARHLTVVGITGTDGKTSTSHMLHAILLAAGKRVSAITTTGAELYGRDSQDLDLHVTTPSPFKLQRILQDAVQVGTEIVILEATSHGLAQHRVLGSNFKIGVVTNITDEHLDYHRTYSEYLRAKAKLFRGVEISILNRDDRSYAALKGLAAGEQRTYSLEAGADLTAEAVHTSLDGTTFRIPEIDREIRSRFVGGFNVQNMLAAASAAVALGIDPDAIAAGLANANPPKGRLEEVDMGQPFKVFVDFAHTSNGLEQMLKMLSEIGDAQLIVVFGCAGERDPNKRRPMGESAGKYASKTVITAEDPRTEDLEQIMDEIAAGVEAHGGVLGESYFRVPDRAEAIDFAIRKLAKPGDVVISTGKAHEKSMCFGTVEHPWDEFAAVRNALSRLQAFGGES